VFDEFGTIVFGALFLVRQRTSSTACYDGRGAATRRNARTAGSPHDRLIRKPQHVGEVATAVIVEKELPEDPERATDSERLGTGQSPWTSYAAKGLHSFLAAYQSVMPFTCLVQLCN